MLKSFAAAPGFSCSDYCAENDFSLEKENKEISQANQHANRNYWYNAKVTAPEKSEGAKAWTC
jgi:hypothetical protein